MIVNSFFLLTITAFFTCLVLFFMGKKIAPLIGLVDKPDILSGGRKDHKGAIPLIGGIIIDPVFATLTLYAGFQSLLPLYPLFAAVSILLIMGLIDDRIHISPRIRFFLQIAVAIFVVLKCNVELTELGNLFGFGNVDLGWGSKIFSVTCLVLLMNAINMLDGVDGLVGSFLIAVLSWLAFVFYSAGHTETLWAILFLLTPVLAFLCFNARYPFHPKASIFLGDAGSLSLALLLGYFSILSAQEVGIDQILHPVSIIWLMTLPIVDTFAVFFVRVKQGRSPFSADRLHAHYKLIDHGFTPGQTTVILFLFAVLTGAIGVLAPYFGVPEYVLLYSWSVIWLGYTAHRLKNA